MGRWDTMEGAGLAIDTATGSPFPPQDRLSRPGLPAANFKYTTSHFSINGVFVAIYHAQTAIQVNTIAPQSG
jgi:hypothetical protein